RPPERRRRLRRAPGRRRPHPFPSRAGNAVPAARSGADGPLVILAFTSEDAFRSCVPRHAGEPRAVDGFFQGGTARRLIAVNLRAERTDPYDALYHEYAHLALNRALPAQPAWVAEGLAELYSAWEP